MTQSKAAPLLSLTGLHKSFRPDVFKPAFQSLKGIDLVFPEGQCTGLVGHNGAGKTTTIRIILGLIKPDQGQIFYRGSPISRNHRATIGYMAESSRFPGALTPREVLATQLSLHYRGKQTASHREMIDQKLHSVGLENSINRRIRDFSKGMAQRLAWAHATIHDPDLLILDEPFTGLDPLGRLTMKNWILEEKKRGITIVLCTHELPQIMSLCDHIQILKKGQLVYSSIAKNLTGGQLDGNLPRYFLDISGAKVADMDSLALTKKLSRWQSIQQDGFLIRMGFNDYSSAVSWIEPCLGKGFVVVRFGDDNNATEEQLLIHFQEEFTQ